MHQRFAKTIQHHAGGHQQQPCEKATCPITSIFRPMVRRRALCVRPADLSVFTRSVFPACNAGTSPNASALPIAANRLNSRHAVIELDARERWAESLGIWIPCRNRMPRYPNPKPSTPPRSDSARLSIRSWRIRRARPAPMANRIAISRERDRDRASIRLATLAHAISSTSPTSAISMMASAESYGSDAQRACSSVRTATL